MTPAMVGAEELAGTRRRHGLDRPSVIVPREFHRPDVGDLEARGGLLPTLAGCLVGSAVLYVLAWLACCPI